VLLSDMQAGVVSAEERKTARVVMPTDEEDKWDTFVLDESRNVWVEKMPCC
jgi:hypothetical protein